MKPKLDIQVNPRPDSSNSDAPMVVSVLCLVGLMATVGCVDPLSDATTPTINESIDTSFRQLIDAAVSGDVDRGIMNPSDMENRLCPGEGEACTTGLPGRCGPGTKVCEGRIAVCTPNEAETSESCNGIDDDCDTKTDEAFSLEEMECELPAGSVCAGQMGVSACRNGAVVCQPIGEDESCNGVDDDCDERIDEEQVCGQYVVDHCKLWLARANGNGLGRDLTTQYWYGTCPLVPEVLSGAQSCNSTDHTDDFKLINFNIGPIGRNNNLAVAFQCDEGTTDGISRRIETHCQFFLGHRARVGSGQGSLESWGLCPTSFGNSNSGFNCTGTGGDGLFHAMVLTDELVNGQGFGIAWRCDIPGDESWSEILTEDIEIYLGISKGTVSVFAPSDGQMVEGSPGQGYASVWSQCPDLQRDNAGNARCVSTNGDGQFHQVGLPAGNLTVGSMMSIRMAVTEHDDEDP